MEMRKGASMFSYSDVERLLGSQTAARSVLSLYLAVPKDPAELRELPARADDAIALAVSDHGTPRGAEPSQALAQVTATRLGDHDEEQVRKLIEAHGREWLGHTAAIFVSGEIGLTEAIRLPGQIPERAIVAARPHVRPLLAALQRAPVYYIVIADRRHAWMFRVSGDEIEAAGSTTQSGEVRSRGFAGWYGLESYRINERVIELAHQHYQDTAAMLERAIRPGGQEPVVIGGHEDTIAQFTAALPTGLRDRVAGSFGVDPHTMTPASVRDLAAPLIADWVAAGAERLVLAMRQDAWRRDPLTVTGLLPTLVAVSQHAVAELLVPVGGTVPGFVCERCGVLSSTGTDCPDGPSAARWVPDLFEEMVVATISDGGRVDAVYDPPGDVSAHLRFPVV